MKYRTALGGQLQTVVVNKSYVSLTMKLWTLASILTIVGSELAKNRVYHGR